MWKKWDLLLNEVIKVYDSRHMRLGGIPFQISILPGQRELSFKKITLAFLCPSSVFPHQKEVAG